MSACRASVFVSTSMPGTYARMFLSAYPPICLHNIAVCITVFPLGVFSDVLIFHQTGDTGKEEEAQHEQLALPLKRTQICLFVPLLLALSKQERK